MIYTLISNEYATMYELNNLYSIEEVLDMYEACLVNLHNKVAGINSFKKEQRRD